MKDPELRLRHPSRRAELPSWSVWLDGEQIGQIGQKAISGSRSPFFEALAMFPGSGELVSLELDTDRDKQASKLVAFRFDPTQFARHLSDAQRARLEL